MQRERKANVIEWNDPPDEPEWTYSVTCEHCEADLLLPTAQGTRILATKGMGIFFDNTPQPDNAVPESVQCPVCRHTYDRLGVPA